LVAAFSKIKGLSSVVGHNNGKHATADMTVVMLRGWLGEACHAERSRASLTLTIAMTKLFLILLLLVMFAAPAYAQLTDFPIGFRGVPRAKLRGPVRTVLTIEQRGEHVFSTVVEVYDRTGKLTETLSSNANIEIHSGTLVRLGGKTIYHYDGQGRLERELSFTPDGKYTGSEVYLYDSSNRLAETTIYGAAGKEIGKSTYTYFPEKREVLATWNFYLDGRKPSPMKNLLSYNEKGQWTKRTEFGSDGNPDAVITFEYDQKGNFIKASKCCKYTYAHSYTYVFDNRSNWIEQRDTQSQPGREPDHDWMRKYRVIRYYSDSETKPR
jgi:hypothetical protein